MSKKNDDQWMNVRSSAKNRILDLPPKKNLTENIREKIKMKNKIRKDFMNIWFYLRVPLDCRG